MEDNISEAQKQRINEKVDLILQEMRNFRKRLEEKSKQSDKIEIKLAKLEADNKEAHNENMNALESIMAKFETITKRIDSKIDNLDNKIAKLNFDNETAHMKIFENLDRIDRRITTLKSDNNEEHRKITSYLDSINSAFIRYETDGIDKIRILFDSDVDRKKHQDIYGHEFKYLHDLVAKNSFRISNLEKHQSEN